MAKRYGVPYQGSKNLIAREIADRLPYGEVLVDLFAGGCAVTHACMELCEGFLPKWERIIVNDINPLPTQLFFDAINGKYHDERRWIDRETFHAMKKTDPYIRYCWSFGNKGQDYLYAKEVEPYKRSYWYAARCHDFTHFEAMGINPPETVRDPTDRFKLRRWLTGNDGVRAKYRAWMGREVSANGYGVCGLQRLQSLESLERLQSLESLERLQSLESLQSLERYALSYEQVPIPEGAVIYCDIPYEGTRCDGYVGSFNHAAFYDWAAGQKNIYISSYQISDPRFEVVWERAKGNLLAGGQRKITERMYTVKGG